MGDRFYYYDLHCHTTDSLCGAGTLKSMVKTAKKRGLDGIAVTDHNKIYQGPEEVADITIIPGVEVSVDNDKHHLLVYYPKKHIERDRDFKQTLEEIRAEKNGYTFWAHPLRDGDCFAEEDDAVVSLLDGLESGNAMNSERERKMIEEKAEELGVLCVAGSDGHTSGQVGMGVVKTKERLTEDNFLKVLSEAEVVVAEEIISFRRRNKRWRVFMRISKSVFRLKNHRFLKSMFTRIFLRNYLRLNNIFLQRAKINYKQQG